MLRTGPSTARCAAALAVLAVLAACGSGSGPAQGSRDAETATPLTQQQAEEALLTEENLGGDLHEVPVEDDPEDTDVGCLSALEDLEEAEPATKAETEFELTEGLTSVSSAVSSYDRTATVVDAFDAFRDAVDGCDEVQFTDEDGTTLAMDVAVDDEKITPEVDDQINLTGTGTASTEGMELPFGMWFSVARVDNHVTMTAVTDLGDQGGTLLDAYAEIAADRLVAVAAGETPEDAVAAPYGEGVDAVEGADEGERAFEELPLDGGTYTWQSTGVTMTLSVERVEPWGDTDDFCGDGSCGVANPDDTRLLLRYEVSVPEDYPAPFDPYACPGSLHVSTGNDDEALSGVLGDFYRELGGKIFPGATKFGVEEYYIEKAYAKEDFYLESTCGDGEDGTGESAYFVGPVRDVS